jgi:uncharacterized membrane protein HdeD (DUF308 family)
MELEKPYQPLIASQLRRIVKIFFEHHRRAAMVAGLILLGLGAAALAAPSLASVIVTILASWLLFVSGLVDLAVSWTSRKPARQSWFLPLGTAAAGLLFIIWPRIALTCFSLALGAYLVCDGVMKLARALRHRRERLERWGRSFLKGSFDLLLALAITIMIGPGINAWIVGVVAAAELLFEGLWLMAMVAAGRRRYGSASAARATLI